MDGDTNRIIRELDVEDFQVQETLHSL